jgi:anaerobic selenocysteine-containing dehydrogenase
MVSKEHHTYCPMCVAQCGVVAVVDDGRFSRVRPDSDHPNGGICIKGYSAPEIVYSPDRLLHPMKRTRPKGDPDPGWTGISWDEALDTITLRLSEIKQQHGAEAVVFGRSTPDGSAASDFVPWLMRLANAFGSPNVLTTTHICTWNVLFGSKHTFGVPTPPPDYENTRCILLWGANPYATFPTSAQRIARARAGGARLIVIDPRQHRLAREADCWLRVRPGSDAALALSMIHVLLEENLYDEAFIRNWTTGPFLVRDDTNQLVTPQELSPSNAAAGYVVWDSDRQRPVIYGPKQGYSEQVAQPALEGTFRCRLDGGEAECRPAFALLKDIAARYSPEHSEEITWVPATAVRNAVRMFATTKPSCLFSWAGVEMHGDAMQTNRTISCFYALTGQFDEAGSNVLTALTPNRPMSGPNLLPRDKLERRLGWTEFPLGPPRDPGIVQAARVYDAILTGHPYPVRAMLLFGSDPLLSHANGQKGARALSALDFYAHMDPFANPSAAFADVLLPATSPWEAEALKPTFGGRGGTREASSWAQMRKAVIAPLGEARSDLSVIFDLACRLGLDAHFFGGDVDMAWNYQLEPSGITVQQLRTNPLGMNTNVTTQYRKYAVMNAKDGRPRGFPTPSGRIELYSTGFAKVGLDPLATYTEPADSPIRGGEQASSYPLVLTSFRLRQFVDDQHRNIPRLRDQEREPFVEIHPDTAAGLGVGDGEWVNIETIVGKVRLKARFNGALHPEVVCAPYGGWWQSCRELNLKGHNPLGEDGANINLIIQGDNIDPISASVPHRSGMCRVSKVPDPTRT